MSLVTYQTIPDTSFSSFEASLIQLHTNLKPSIAQHAIQKLTSQIRNHRTTNVHT